MSASTLEKVTTAPSSSSRPGSAARTPARPTKTEAPATGGTAPFVLLIMVLLAGGLVTTLWLSTAAAADSYRLDAARQSARELSEQTERLHRDVAARESAPALAAAATGIGMVPAGAPAVLVVAPDGTSRVVGNPTPAHAAASAPSSAPGAAPARAAAPEDAREQSSAR